MRTATIAAATAAAIALTAVPASAAKSLPPPNDTALKAAISGLPTQDTSGAFVRITGSSGDWFGTSGVSDLSTNAPVDPDGNFRIGSATKTFTAVMVLQLSRSPKVVSVTHANPL
ncbi:MAG: beta-lactamase family protein [Actinomycetota bacterium]|nr:beta-lactamase family protein [Actinomycetota bacterium]